MTVHLSASRRNNTTVLFRATANSDLELHAKIVAIRKWARANKESLVVAVQNVIEGTVSSFVIVTD